MQRDAFDAYCTALKSATHVVQWRGSSVWKVGGKIFAICSTVGEGQHDKISFKCTDLSYAILCEQAEIIPAPYLARAKWVQVVSAAALSDAELQSYIEEAHAIIAQKLTRVQRAKLGL